MISIQYPAFPFKIKGSVGKETIFDECRKRWVRLTPEEWVRQNFLQYLIQVAKYPASLIAVERELLVSNQKKRFDIVVYKHAAPWMIVECKEPSVVLHEAVIRQVLTYNITLQATFLVITNGHYTYAMQLQNNSFTFLEQMPCF